MANPQVLPTGREIRRPTQANDYKIKVSHLASAPHSGGVDAICGLSRRTDVLEILTGGKDKQLALWRVDPSRAAEPNHGESVTLFPCRHSSAIRSIATSSDGTSIYTGGADRKVE